MCPPACIRDNRGPMGPIHYPAIFYKLRLNVLDNLPVIALNSVLTLKILHPLLQGSLVTVDRCDGVFCYFDKIFGALSNGTYPFFFSPASWWWYWFCWPFFRCYRLFCRSYPYFFDCHEWQSIPPLLLQRDSLPPRFLGKYISSMYDDHVCQTYSKAWT